VLHYELVFRDASTFTIYSTLLISSKILTSDTADTNAAAIAEIEITLKGHLKLLAMSLSTYGMIQFISPVG